MIDISDKSLCCGCSACYNACPKNAINMKKDEEGFLYPEVDQKKCIDCSICEKVCPIANKKEKNNINNTTSILAGKNKNEEIRKNSSSGGIFDAIASYIIENAGVVCAASYDENMQVIHKIAFTKEEVRLLRGSKYVQSNIGRCFSTVKKLLEEKKLVLFVGTPCQVSGLIKFLPKNYDNLYLCDFICHGVPSPKVYEKYKNELEEKFHSKIIKMDFRNKEKGWENYSIIAEFENGKKYSKLAKRVPYIKGFLKNVYLRPSCYNCKFATLNRLSDITLGDYWGIKQKDETLDDNKGTSLILIHSNKGRELVNFIKGDIDVKEQDDIEFIIRNNPSLISPAKINNNRKRFFKDIEKYNLNKLYRKYFYQNKYINKVKRILKLGKENGKK